MKPTDSFKTSNELQKALRFYNYGWRADGYLTSVRIKDNTKKITYYRSKLCGDTKIPNRFVCSEEVYRILKNLEQQEAI